METNTNEPMAMYLLYNPKSGRETIKNSLSDIVETFSHAGYEIVVRPTSYGGEATKLIADLPDVFDVVVCCGGDGTLSEVVAGNLKRDVPLKIGYIPCGSTNDFGRTIYGEVSVQEAAEHIVNSPLHAVDCGRLEDRSFVYTAAFGTFTDISYATPHEQKAALGHAAYLIEAAKNLGNIKSHQVKAVIDGGEVIEGRFLVGMVSNAESVGGIQNITGKDVKLDDGVIELTLIGRLETPADYGKALQAIMDGSQNEIVIRRKVKTVQFTFDEPMAFTVDGEYGGTYQTAKVSCIPAAIPLYY